MILTRHIIVTMDSQAHQFSDLNLIGQTATDLGVGLCEITGGVDLISYSADALGQSPQFCQRKVLVFDGDRNCLCREESQTPSPNTTGYRNSLGALFLSKTARFSRESPRGPFLIGHDLPVPVAAGFDDVFVGFVVGFVVGLAVALVGLTVALVGLTVGLVGLTVALVGFAFTGLTVALAGLTVALVGLTVGLAFTGLTVALVGLTVALTGLAFAGLTIALVGLAFTGLGAADALVFFCLFSRSIVWKEVSTLTLRLQVGGLLLASSSSRRRRSTFAGSTSKLSLSPAFANPDESS